MNYKCVENACYKVKLVKSPKPGCGTTLKGRPVDTGNKSYKVTVNTGNLQVGHICK